jgi:sterol desaturase/sphingolipid hydroxylase (fatty acid hydroxylase superfamily)
MEWVTTFTRFQPGRMRLLGPIVVRVADWSRPQPGRAAMFDQQWLDRLSWAHPAFPPAAYGTAGLWLLWRGGALGLAWGTSVVCYGGGLLAWTLFEYLTHRISFHHTPTSRLQVVYSYLSHGIHHAYPDDSRRWVLPPAVTLPIAVLMFWLFSSTLGRFASPAFAGFLHGYVVYDLLHYFIHRGRLPTAWGRFLRHHHLAHHYAQPDRRFGVSSPLWDVVFRTQ